MAQVDRINGLVGDIAIKAPCRVATTGNITLSGFQTIDGVTLATGDSNLRVMVWQQTNGVDNGIWVASSGAWTRSADFDGDRDVTTGTLCKIISGTTYGGQIAELTTTGTITIGTTSLAFAMRAGTLSGTISAFAVTLLDDTTAAAGRATLGAAGLADTNTFTADQSINGLTIGRGAGNVGGNTASGYNALLSNTTGNYNTASGYNALANNTTGNNNTASGYGALLSNTTGSNNTASGYNALANNTTGNNNTASGYGALNNNTTGNYNTASGYNALSNNVSYDNVAGIGYNAQVTGSNQVQLGDSATTTYVYGTVQNRSDIRDKADIRPTVLGLAFINALNPVDFRWDLREDYCERVETIAETGELIISEKKSEKDGTRKRGRFHHGLIAQEVGEIISASGIDFGGLQDHKKNGGQDVYTLGYDEFIAPLIKAIQELSTKNVELELRLTKAGIA